MNWSNPTPPTEDEDDDDGAEPPVIGLARGEPNASKQRTGRSRGNSRSSIASTVNTAKSFTSRTRNILEPILHGKKGSVSDDGNPRNDHVWRHPSTWENSRSGGDEQVPVYVGAGLGDISHRPSVGRLYIEDSDDEDVEGAEFGAENRNLMRHRRSLFGEGLVGLQTLPGLKSTPAGRNEAPVLVGASEGERDLVRRESNLLLGEATQALRRLRDRKSSIEATVHGSVPNVNATETTEIEKGV